MVRKGEERHNHEFDYENSGKFVKLSDNPCIWQVRIVGIREGE